jgi:hypothetical protein
MVGMEPGSLSGLFLSIGNLFSMFEKLNLTFRVHGGILVSGTEFDEAVFEDWPAELSLLDTFIPGWSPTNYVPIDGTNPCPP